MAKTFLLLKNAISSLSVKYVTNAVLRYHTSRWARDVVCWHTTITNQKWEKQLLVKFGKAEIMNYGFLQKISANLVLRESSDKNQLFSYLGNANDILVTFTPLMNPKMQLLKFSKGFSLFSDVFSLPVIQHFQHFTTLLTFIKTF